MTRFIRVVMDEFVQVRTCRHHFQQQENTHQQRGNDCPAGTLEMTIHVLQTVCFKQSAYRMQAFIDNCSICDPSNPDINWSYDGTPSH